MKVERNDRFSVTITPESSIEAYDLLNVASIKFTLPDGGVNAEAIEVITHMKEVTIKAHRSATDGGGGFRRVTVNTDFLEVYWDRLERQFGGRRANWNLTSALRRITHTHFAENLEYDVERNVAFYTSVVCAYPNVSEQFQSDLDFERRAIAKAKCHIADELGKAVIEPEFVPYGDRFYKRNPKYGRYNPQYTPCVTNEKVWQLMLDLWRAEQASEKQKQILARATPYWNTTSSQSDILHLDQFNTHMRSEEFAALK